MLPEFELVTPRNVDEAVQVLGQLGDRARILAGGTDVLVQMRARQSRPEYLVDIKSLAELKGIEFSAERGLVIGALVTHHALETLPLIRENYPILYDGVSRVGSVQIRNRGTIGGNICNALPSADSIAPLLALGALLQIRGPKGDRQVAMEDFFLGPRKVALGSGEILTHIVVPPHPEPNGGAYVKFTRRKAMDLALLGVAVFLECESDGQTCRQARIALATAAPIPMRAHQAEAALQGKKLNSEVLQEAGEIAAREARPRTSWRSTEEYRRHLIKVLVPRAANLALERMKMS